MDGLLPLVGTAGSDFFTGPAIRALVLGHTVMMAMALPLTVIAVRSYRDAPWSRTLRPLPVVTAALLCSSSLNLVLADARLSGYAGAFLWAVAGVGFTWSAVEAFLLLTGRRRV